MYYTKRIVGVYVYVCLCICVCVCIWVCYMGCVYIGVCIRGIFNYFEAVHDCGEMYLKKSLKHFVFLFQVSSTDSDHQLRKAPGNERESVCV